MAKQEQRRVARTLFVEQGLNRKEIAERLKVREKTVGEWCRDGNWEELRTQRLVSSDSVITNLKQLMSQLSEKRMAMERDPEADASEKARITDELAKVSKALSEAREEGEITLGRRLAVMDWVFSELRKRDPATHQKLIDFQEALLDEAARLHA